MLAVKLGLQVAAFYLDRTVSFSVPDLLCKGMAVARDEDRAAAV